MRSRARFDTTEFYGALADLLVCCCQLGWMLKMEVLWGGGCGCTGVLYRAASRLRLKNYGKERVSNLALSDRTSDYIDSS